MSPTDRSRCRPRSAIAAIAICLALLAGACGPAGSSPSPSATSTVAPTPVASSAPPVASSSGRRTIVEPNGDANAIYDAVEAQVVAIRGLQPKRPVARQFIDRAELRTLLTQMFDQDTPPAYLAGTERLYRALGLIPAETNLRTLSLDLLSGGVAGFYRNDQGKLYVVSKSGGAGPDRAVLLLARVRPRAPGPELDDLQGLRQGPRPERPAARPAVDLRGRRDAADDPVGRRQPEPSELLQVLASGTDPAAQAAMAAAPAILRETLTFPYTVGFSYVTTIQSTGGWPAVNAYFTKMPRSTEQILHPEKYTAGEAPIAVTMPADLATRLGSGWTVPAQDTFGEFQIGIWLRESGVASADATAAAAGWGGDRVAVIEGPSGAWAVAIETAWDTDADAAQFETAATTAKAKATGTAEVLPGVGGKTRWFLVASDASTLAKPWRTPWAWRAAGRRAAPTSTRARRSPAAPARWRA